MKKIIFLTSVCAAFSVNALFANGNDKDLRVQTRICNLSPANDLVEDIYGRSQACYALEVSKAFHERYEIWVNLDRLSADGQTSYGQKSTSYSQSNVSTGGKYLFPIHQKAHFYIGLGVNAAFVNIYNDSDYVKRSVRKQGIGGVTKTGFYIESNKDFFIDVFVDYLYQQIKFEDKKQLGGVKAGIGIGLHL